MNLTFIWFSYGRILGNSSYGDSCTWKVSQQKKTVLWCGWVHSKHCSITGHNFILIVLKASSFQIFFEGGSICTSGCPMPGYCIAKPQRLYCPGNSGQQIPITRFALTFQHLVSPCIHIGFNFLVTVSCSIKYPAVSVWGAGKVATLWYCRMG